MKVGRIKIAKKNTIFLWSEQEIQTRRIKNQGHLGQFRNALSLSLSFTLESFFRPQSQTQKRLARYITASRD